MSEDHFSKQLKILEDLALDLIWSWSHYSDNLWQMLDPVLWEHTQNPWVVLQAVSRKKLERLFSQAEFCKTLALITSENKQRMESKTWFDKNYSGLGLSCIAYFSMEFMLSEALPIYSGGLGNVAGDQLKAASDLGVPVVGVGLLYQQGYFRQAIDKYGLQQALYPYNDPGQLPIKPLRKADGEWLRIEVPFAAYSIWLRCWEAKVGRVRLYLLDSNDPANFPVHRGITSELYGGGPELRLQQELVLGIGGWRLLKALGLKPDVCHLNEGHAAFASLERAKDLMEENNVSFAAALLATRAGNLFTTHTAVPAGFDRFAPDLISSYLCTYAEKKLQISVKDLLALGRANPEDLAEPFNMAYLAIRGSGFVNGVSRLHREVSQKLFEPLFPSWPKEEIPVGYVTNGVHMSTWDSKAADELWTSACGKNRWLWSTEMLEEKMRALSDEKLWKMRNDSRKALVEYASKKLKEQLSLQGGDEKSKEEAMRLLDPSILTIGFARRFATYKRPNMLLQNKERLLRILNDRQRPVQLLIAGKAHPADKPGQALIQEWMHFIKQNAKDTRIVFLSDYDMHLTSRLVQGVDVWLNTPRRPWEACGTSGMKVLVNGGINLSELDGWWAEAYGPDVGWALGDKKEHTDESSWDLAEADALYDLLEQQVALEFYERNSEGLPVKWITRMRESMARLTPVYSANRAVREYVEKYYIAAKKSYQTRSSQGAKKAKEMLQRDLSIKSSWNKVRFCNVSTREGESSYCFDVQVHLNGLDPQFVSIQIYADALEAVPAVCLEMKMLKKLQGDEESYLYEGFAKKDRPIEHYTVRAVPVCPGLSLPLENHLIKWQK